MIPTSLNKDRSPMPYARAIRYRLLKWGRMILHSNDSPRQIAGGAAVGVFWACNPTVVSQGLFAVVTATLLRFSRIPALALTFISNPATALPIYGSAYMIGYGITRLLGFHPTAWKNVRHLFTRPDSSSGWWSAVREKTAEVASVGWHGLLPMEVGATVLGLLLAAAVYALTVRLVVGHRLLKAQRAVGRAQRRLERVRAEQAVEHAAHASSAPTGTLVREAAHD